MIQDVFVYFNDRTSFNMGKKSEFQIKTKENNNQLNCSIIRFLPLKDESHRKIVEKAIKNFKSDFIQESDGGYVMSTFIKEKKIKDVVKESSLYCFSKCCKEPIAYAKHISEKDLQIEHPEL